MTEYQIKAYIDGCRANIKMDISEMEKELQNLKYLLNTTPKYKMIQTKNYELIARRIDGFLNRHNSHVAELEKLKRGKD